MKKNEYERLKAIAIEKLESSSIVVSEDFLGKDLEELIQINEIYQAELEAQNDELQTHILSLEEAQNELEVLFTLAPVAYTLMTTNFHVLRANEKVFSMFSSLHFLSKNVPFYTHIYKNHLTKFLDWINNEKKEDEPLEILLKTKDGLRYCSLRYHKWSKHDSDTFLLSIIDIHAQKEENDRFKALFENTQQGVVYFDKNGVIVDVNETALDIIEEDSCILKKHNEISWTFLDEDEQSISSEDIPFNKAIKTKEIQKASVFAIYKSLTKKTIWLKMEAIPHFSLENKELIGVFCIFTDVTKEYILDKELKKQLKNFKTLGNNIPDVILRIDEKQQILFANKKASEFFNLDYISLDEIKFSEFSIFKNEESKNIILVLNDLNKLNNPITYSLSCKINNSNKNYFIRIIPEKTEVAKKTFLIIIEDITERIESEDMYNQLFFHASDAIILTDYNSGKIKSINNKASILLGIEQDDLKTLSSSDIFATFQNEAQYSSHIKALESFGVDSYEIKRKLKDNQFQYLKVYCTLIDIGNHMYHQSIIHDLTEHKLLELQLKQRSNVFEHTIEGIMITELNGSVISVNDAFTKITGYTREDVIGKKPELLKSGKQGDEFYKKMWEDINNNGLFKGEIWNKKKDGTIYPEWLAISTIYDDNNKAIQYVAVFSDFSEIKKTQHKLQNLAHYDTLTKLPNRLLLNERIAQFIKLSKRHKSQFAVLFIDLDRFKQINDTYGHETGDKVLKTTSERLKSVVRESDVVSRLGGDEFIVVLNEITNLKNIHKVAKNILNKLQLPFTINNHNHYITCSIGISVYPEDTQKDDIDILIKHADIAMYESKAAGKNIYSMFSQNMADSVKKMSNLHNDLNLALLNKEFYLTYQPQYNVVKNKIVGFESLIRWKHPIKGEVFPDEFIPYAEESQMIIPIGEWVMEQVIEDYYKIHKLLKKNFTIAVNVSHVQINEDFINMLEALIAKHKNFVNIIAIEITETTAMQNLEDTKVIIEAIKKLGFKISLDDFGTGYSSLNSIKTLQIDELKIDRTFFKDVPGDKDDEELVSTIIAMAKIMKKNVVAEGVETTSTRDFLIERRCPIIQGYLISKPMTLEKTLEFFS
nr:EAL domain-containing protein [uncultured Sulfurimonas sp.]